MGEGLIQPDPVPSYTELFEAQQAWYLSWGMSLDEFWNGPPEFAKAYREAAILSERRENARAWREGLYMVSALNATVMNLFKRKGSRPTEYLKEPLPITEQEAKEREIRDMKLREQRIIEHMNRYASSKSVTGR